MCRLLAWASPEGPIRGSLLRGGWRRFQLVSTKLRSASLVLLLAVPTGAHIGKATWSHLVFLGPPTIGSPALGLLGQITPKTQRTPEQQKISSRLLDAIDQRKRGTGNPESLKSNAALDFDDDGRVLVDISGTVSPALLDEIEDLDGQVISSFPQFQAIRARLPLEQIESLAAQSDVRTIRPADIAFTNPSNLSVPSSPKRDPAPGPTN